MATETVGGVRVQSVRADRLVSHVVDRIHSAATKPLEMTRSRSVPTRTSPEADRSVRSGGTGQPAGLLAGNGGRHRPVVGYLLILLAHLAFSAIAFVTKPRAFEWPNPGPPVLATLWWVLLVIYLTIMWSVSGRTLEIK